MKYTTSQPITCSHHVGAPVPVNRTAAWSKTCLLVAAWLGLVCLPCPAQWTNYIELEDYNFEAGQFISDATTGMSGPYAGGVYKDKAAVAEVDLHIVVAHGTGSSSPYRNGDYLNLGLYTSSQLKTTYGREDWDRGYFEVLNNWKISWQEAGEWQNYTRVFSNAVYAVTLRAAHNTSRIKMELASVTSDPTQPNQTTVTIGGTDVPPPDPADVNHFVPIPMTDGLGLPLKVRFSGTNTLRLTQRANSNLDWLQFAAIPGMTVMPPYVVTALPAPDEVLNAMKPVDVLIRHGDSPVKPSTIRLQVNGNDVATGSIITASAGGDATVSYDYYGLLPLSSFIDLQLVYGDSGSPTAMVTNSWTFFSPPSWPVRLSTSAITLAPNQTAPGIIVTIPPGFNASSDVTVDITSSDPSIAVPAGYPGGVQTLTFPAGGTNALTISIQSLVGGTVRFTTENAVGLDVTTLTVKVTPGPLSTVQRSNGDLDVSWSGSGTLQSSDSLGMGAIWSDVAPAPTSPYTVPKAEQGNRKFYRLRL
jgi:hypothetical protein